MTDRELLQQALDALKHLCLHSAAIKGYDGEQVQTAIDALRARLSQPQRDWVGLTDDEIEQAAQGGDTNFWDFCHIIEAKLKEKNG